MNSGISKSVKDVLFKIEAPPLLLIEPSENEIKLHSHKLSFWYSEPENMRLTGSTTPVTRRETIELLMDNKSRGDRFFLIFQEGRLIGDADLRNINFKKGFAEFAIMLGDKECRGLGLGTLAAAAIHKFGFEILGLSSIRLSVAKKNIQAIRSYAKLGYKEDTDSRIQDIESSPGDIILMLTKGDFIQR